MTSDNTPARRQPGASSKVRFWKTASIASRADGYSVELDGRPIRLPGGATLCVLSLPLAEAIAAEWQEAGQDDPKHRFSPEALPLTRITGTMIERVAPDRAHSVTTLLGYGQNDLLCYRTDEGGTLAAQQSGEWQPWLDWCATRYGASLHWTEGMMPVVQSPESLKRLENALNGLSDATMAALGVAVPAMGSLVLGLALAAHAITPDAAVQVATLDEHAQMARWGEDPAVLDRIATVAVDVSDAARFMDLAQVLS